MALLEKNEAVLRTPEIRSLRLNGRQQMDAFLQRRQPRIA
jgi:hypothetical protein